MKQHQMKVILLALFLLSLVGASQAYAAILYSFTPGQNMTIFGAGSMDSSNNPNLWVNSGGTITVTDGIGKSLQGDLPSSSPIYQMYAKSSSGETNGGKQPQNILRLITRPKWGNFAQTNYFKINRYNAISSSNRSEGNGILLMSRYVIDGQTLYYAGLRVDGAMVIKKKLNGTYYTIAYKKVLNGTYNRDSNPILIPLNTWIGIKTVVKNDNGKVNITLEADLQNKGSWTTYLTATDEGSKYGARPLTDDNYAGIRTDFMDVEFKNYKIWSL